MLNPMQINKGLEIELIKANEIIGDLKSQLKNTEVIASGIFRDGIYKNNELHFYIDELKIITKDVSNIKNKNITISISINKIKK